MTYVYRYVDIEKAVFGDETEARCLKMPDGSGQIHSADVELWQWLDWLVEHTDYSQEKLIEMSLSNAEEMKRSFDEAFAIMVGFVADNNCTMMGGKTPDHFSEYSTEEELVAEIKRLKTTGAIMKAERIIANPDDQE